MMIARTSQGRRTPVLALALGILVAVSAVASLVAASAVAPVAALTAGQPAELAVAATTHGAQGEAPQPTTIRFMRTPAVANDGRLAFSFHDDIWIVEADGTGARRLTTHIANDENPRFSPAGGWIAFTSNRSGNNDAWLVAAGGGEPRQLTFHTGSDRVVNWTPDGQAVIVASGRGRHPWGSPLYRVPLDGTIPTAYPMDMSNYGAINREGTLLAFNRDILPPTTRKEYRGLASATLYVLDLRTTRITHLTGTDLHAYQQDAHDGYPMWGADGLIYFVSERDGFFNIWRMDVAGGGLEQLTRFREGGVQTPSISPDGRRIVFVHDFELYTMDVPGGQPRRVPVQAVPDMKHNMVSWVSTTNRADGFVPSPNGDVAAVDFRGEIVIVPVDRATGELRRVTASPWRERYPEFSPDGRLLAYVSDESLEEEIWVFDLATGQKRKLTTHESQKSSFVWSPDSRKIAFVGAKRLMEVDVASGRTRELGYNEAGGYSLSEYSADGNWLVYNRSDESQNAEVYLFDTRSGREINVTHSLDREGSGRLTPDGRHVVFTSNRDAGVNHLFVVSLARLREDPDDPLVRARQQGQRPPDDTAAAGAAPAARPARGAPLDIRVDEAGIEQRARQLTSGSNGVANVFLSADGRTIYFTSSDGDGAGLFAIGIDGQNRRRVAAGSFPSLTPTADRRRIFFRQANGDIMRLTLAQPQRRDQLTFQFDVRVDHPAEWEQIFEESWRIMKYRFYDPNMHGKDWDAIKARYKPYLAYVGSNEDAYDLAHRMIGELNASHTGVSGPASVATPRGQSMRNLGLELEPAEGGRYRISHVYRTGPADREWLDVKPGNFVLALDGEELHTPENYWKRLMGQLNEYVTLRVADSPDGANARDLRIRTVTGLGNIKYEEWVLNNRDFVELQTDSTIAYVHIRSMNQASLERFRREIDRYWDRHGIIIDVRYNGGGNIDEQLIDIIERRPYNHVNPRTGARTWGRRPRQAIAGPKVMMINYRSGSDAEATPMAFKTLELGRLVGHPTRAGVIWTGSYSLINGASIRTPFSLAVTWDPTQPDNYGINLENYGVPPDVWVRNTPEDEREGKDPELQAAIDEVLRMLREGNYFYGTGPRR